MEGRYARDREARMTVEEEETVSKVFRVFKGAVTTVGEVVVVYRAVRSQRRGSTVHGGQMR